MHIVQHLHDFVAAYGYFAVIILVGLESAGVPLPGETALVTAAVFAGQGTLHIGWVIASAALAAIIGEGRLKVAQYLFMRHGGKIVFFGRFIAILRAFAAFLAGVNRMPWPQFLLFNAMGGIVWASIFGLGGYFLGLAFEHYARPVGLAALACAVIGAVLASRFIGEREHALRAEAEAALPGPLVAPKG
jgi:membrane protein DedA with SNARE-associated domain